MKKIIIGTLVGTIIFFLFQTIMWEGGFHDDFRTFTPNQTAIMNALNQNIKDDGMYMFPMADPASSNKKQEEEKMWKEGIGKPWAMIFYHKSMNGMEAGFIIMGFLYNLIACLIAALVLFYGNFSTFNSRFLVSMALAFFTLSQGVLDNMNWWSYPWTFVKPEVIDLTLGWGICSVWLARYFKK